MTDQAPHACRNPVVMDAAAQITPLLSPIDQWGALPFPGRRLTPHSLSRRVRDLLAGDLGAHRTLTVDPDNATEPNKPIPVPVPPRPVFTDRDRQQAWDRRRVGLRHLAGVNEELTDVERRADELNTRAMALLETEQSGSQQTGH